ncbi:MAG TPA: GFA family protein [Polyangiaceae bacterium]|nr:GFA family protein [Polyangiaceae bacterium]
MSDASEAPGPLPWQGGCRCDKLRFQVNMAPILSAACHCAGCQRMSASAFSLTLIVPGPGLEIIEGEPVVGGLHAPELQHMCCDHCKSWVFTRVEQFGIVNVRATMLDTPRWFVPYMETCVSEKLPWATTPAVQHFEQFPAPDSYPTLLAEYAAWARERQLPVA